MIGAPAPRQLPAPIRSELQSSGLRVLKDNEALCEIWFRKDLPLTEPSGMDRSYPPVAETTLLGAIRVIGGLTDNRANSFGTGLYTMRLGLQPQDGNHVGASRLHRLRVAP